MFEDLFHDCQVSDHEAALVISRGMVVAGSRVEEREIERRDSERSRGHATGAMAE